ncbi:MAG TPA: trypsin-like peptidase domain-containing protein [Vicinamibacterales bacterium]|nr:trypsin-like peptidase domain-containing protein [Vicinamibacterales bacterium]
MPIPACGPCSNSARRFAVPILCAVTACLLPLTALAQSARTDPLQQMNEAVDALTRKVWPSVVQIMVTGYGTRDDNGRSDVSAVLSRQRSVGSGFVIDPEGYIMTNAHVVSGAQRVEVVLPASGADGSLMTALTPKTTVVPARVVGTASEIDLALLKVDGLSLPALPLATYRQLRQGETVFAFGSPGGLRNTLTHGLVSAVARQTDPDSPLIFIQTDAPINPGNSGGPLVNIRGEVVGVNTFILSPSGGSDGLGFAIPCATVRTVFRQLKEHGRLRRQEVGMSIQTITPIMATSLGLPRTSGVVVSDVWPGGPAEAAGLKIGDILVSIDGDPADNLPTVNYNFRLRDSPMPVRMVVLRGTSEVTLNVSTIEQYGTFDSITIDDPAQDVIPELGIMGVGIDARIASQAKGLRDPLGVIVAARVAGGTAGDVPLQQGDVIRTLNTQVTASVKDLRDLLRKTPAGAPITLQIQRDGRLMYVSFTLE